MTGLSISRRDARRSALQHLVDYAGLFPPAALDMAGAVAGYRDARSGGEAWIVDRFICPAARLEELVGVLAPTMTAGEARWPLSVTASPGWSDSLAFDAGAVRMFSDTVGSAASVDLVEARVPDEVAADSASLGTDATDFLRAFEAVVFFELPWYTAPFQAMEALQRLRSDSGRALGVKMRCGGLSAELFPSPEQAARFFVAAATNGLPLKATAGLHHPFRHVDPRTGFHHHGFVNILGAAALAHAGESESTVAAVLADEDPAAFALEPTGLEWRGQRVGASQLDQMRSDLFVSYGSCSFDEPVVDLTALGVLPVESS